VLALGGIAYEKPLCRIGLDDDLGGGGWTLLLGRCDVLVLIERLVLGGCSWFGSGEGPLCV